MKFSSRFAFVLLVLVGCKQVFATTTAGEPTDSDFSATGNWGASSAQTYDFIIMGAGAAGSVLAAKLSQNPAIKVLLLEAGGASQRSTGGTDYVMNSFKENPATGGYVLDTPFTRFDVPSYGPTLTDPILFAQYNWNITGSNAGKSLGGSMAHNGMLWVHPTPANVATWGVDGWSYDEFIPWVRATENHTSSGFPYDPTVGYSGPIHVQISSVILPAELVFRNMCLSVGIPSCVNMNGEGGPNGICPLSFNIGNDGVRQSSAHTYLAPAMTRSNLVISLFSQGARVLFSSATSTHPVRNATGITYVQTLPNGSTVKHTAYASREVILAGGGLNSPKTLMLSGIGPAEELKHFNITPVHVNENVGQNMRNHYIVEMVFSANNATLPNFENIPDQAIQYGTVGTGIYACSTGLGSFWTEVKSLPNLVDPDIDFTASYLSSSLFDKTLTFLVGGTTAHYKRGTVTLASSNPLVDAIYTQNASPPDSVDNAALIRGIRKVRQVMTTPTGLSYFGPELVPGADVSSDANLTTFIANNNFLAFHYYGSTKMGNATDPLAVVDPHFRVLGVNKLRVIDSGTIPGIVNSGIQCTTTAFGLRGASIVLADNNLPPAN